MKRNTKTQWVKISTQTHFTLYQSQMNPTQFQARLKASGNYLRRRFQAPDVASALLEAPKVIGLIATSQKHKVNLLDAFQMTLEASNRNELAHKEWFKTVENFLVWLNKKHPLCTHWGLMNRQILREYLSTYDGKSANYRRLSLQPILQTSGFMHREYDFPNISERLGIGNKLSKTPPAVYLEDVISFCEFTKDNYPSIFAGVCLQGLVGLQLQEALRLTWDKVDFERSIIEVSGEVKNIYRIRVIPVCDYVLTSLKTSYDDRSTKSNRILCGIKGQAFSEYRSYGRQMRKQLDLWNPENEWAPKDLRNCLPTFAKMNGIHGTIWEQYIGHAPEGVTDRHYVPRLSASLSGEKKALDRQMQLFRSFVTKPVDEQICNFLQHS